jgi:hypothetical protein
MSAVHRACIGRPRHARGRRRHRPSTPRMSGVLLIEQALNGLQFGLMLFLLAAG